MLYSLILTALISQAPEKAILDKVPEDWYRSTTRLFEYCVDVQFQHPVCPQINKASFSDVDFQSEFFKAPVDQLNYRTLFQAFVLYEVGRPPVYWFVGLELSKDAPEGVSSRLYAEARWLWARILFDQGKYEESLKFFNLVVDEMKGRALFHQQRAWAQFFNSKFDRALGSIVSAESPLIYSVPYFEKFFLRALIEKEKCRYGDAIRTITSGRAALRYSKADPSQHPWVVLCERRKLGTTCSRLHSWYQRVYNQKVKKGLNDLDLLEIELRDRLTPGQKEKSSSPVRWPFIGENWRDELGYHSVPIESKCG